MIRRTYDKLNNNIPISQAAYREGRSTTELIFTVKTLAEKAITSSSYQITVLLLDMSKAFDTVDRGQLFRDLSDFLEEDELHMISILLKDVTLQVRIGKHTGPEFITNVGVPQGDCLSPVLFTIYLARAMKGEETEHNYARSITHEEIITPQLRDHTYSRPPIEQPIVINQQYADDIGWVTTAKYRTTYIKKTMPTKLKRRNLYVNEGKTEEYDIKRGGDETWKKCKYVGSLIDTEEDIKRRKQLSMTSYNQHKNLLNSKKIKLTTRMRIFEAYITSIFLYNSEVWSLNKNLENIIDVYQRNLLRKILDIKWAIYHLQPRPLRAHQTKAVE